MNGTLYIVDKTSTDGADRDRQTQMHATYSTRQC